MKCAQSIEESNCLNYLNDLKIRQKAMESGSVEKDEYLLSLSESAVVISMIDGLTARLKQSSSGPSA